MSNWNLATILSSLHTDIQGRLGLARSSFAHPGVKGDASEAVWLSLLQTYLPKRYQAETVKRRAILPPDRRPILGLTQSR